MIFLRICLVLVLLNIVSKVCCQVQFTPSSFNASEGSDPVVFTCSSSVTGNIFLLVDGTNVADQTIQRERGLAVDVVNSSLSMLSIKPFLNNSQVPISCLFINGSISTTLNAELMVQGRLSAPPELVINNQSSGLLELAWKPPFTLDLTGQDPDILGYRVCFLLSLPDSDMKSPQCSTTQGLAYSFVNVGLLLNFSVEAVNPVGVGADSSVVHQPCPDAAFVNITVVGIEVVQSGENHTISASVEVPPQTKCYDVYQLELEPVSTSSSSAVSSPLLLPVVNGQQLQFDYEFSDLTENTIYLTTLTAVNINGEKIVAQNISLSTYDIQSVSAVVLANGNVEVSCSFISTSMSQGCRVTLCMLDQEQMAKNCTTELLSRSGNMAITVLPELAEGTYLITRVEDIEEDGQSSEVNDLTVFNLQAFNVTSGVLTTQGPTFSTSSVGPGTQGPLQPGDGGNTRVIIGAVVGGAAVAILLLLIVVALCFICYKEKTSSSYTLGTTPGTRKKKKFVDSEEVVEEQAMAAPSQRSTEHTTFEVDLGVEFGDEPLSASFYDLPDVEKAPSVPLKKSRGSRDAGDITSPVLLSPPSGWEGPLDNLSQEDIQEVCLTPPTQAESVKHVMETEAGSEHRSISPTPVKVDIGSVANSRSPPTQRPPTYAEVMHVTTPKSNKLPHDKTSVYYSEIKIENSPPNLPKKKGTASSSSSLNGSSSGPGWSEGTIGTGQFEIRTSQTDETITGYQV